MMAVLASAMVDQRMQRILAKGGGTSASRRELMRAISANPLAVATPATAAQLDHFEPHQEWSDKLVRP